MARQAVGRLIDWYAGRHGVSNGKAIKLYMDAWIEEHDDDPKRNRSISTINYYRNDKEPDGEWLELFAEVFELTDEEMGAMAFASKFPKVAAA